MEDRTLTLIKWMNKTFINLQQNNLHSITDLRDPFCVEQILIEM